jgi:hypothetical protein
MDASSSVARTDEPAGILNEVFMMQQPDDDGMATDDKRLLEIAELLAAGILRLRCRAALSPVPAIAPGPKIPPNSSPNCLD